MLNVLLWLEYRASVIKLVNKVPKQQEVKVSKVTVYKESLMYIVPKHHQTPMMDLSACQISVLSARSARFE